jgi:hypothetical protein
LRNVGARRFEMTPGYYGSFDVIEEDELTRRRKIGTFGDTVDLSELILDRQQELTVAEINRIKLICWTLATTGTFSTYDERGNLSHTDEFPLQTFTPATAWSNLTSSTPLKDLRAAKAQFEPGVSVSFNSQSKLRLNTVTLNNVLNNRNANDLGGVRREVGATLNNLEDINKIFMANDLPQLEAYDDGYYNLPKLQGGTFSRFIATNKAVLFGKRLNNQALGEYRMTMNANNPNMESGSYMHISDSIDSNIKPVPRQIRIDKGHNGGPVIYYPSAIVIFNV